MREGTVNDVIHSLVKDGKQQVKDVLQYISLQTNHRTHAQNLACVMSDEIGRASLITHRLRNE